MSKKFFILGDFFFDLFFFRFSVLNCASK